MQRLCTAVIGCLVLASSTKIGWTAEPTWNYAVQVSAAVQSAPPQISLSWPQDALGTPNSYSVYRKAPGATSWGAGTTLAGTATTYTDAGVSAGSTYEYQIVKAASTYSGYGYICAGVNAPLVESRGKVVLVVDNTYAANLAAELTRLQQDLAGDGWTVIRHDVARNDTVPNVKNLIKADYIADPANVKSVFLFGHVPVPYSGQLNPDGHADHVGAWPADVYYGDMDGNWTDSTVNYLQTVNTDPADRARLSNVPGDGKFDQTAIPSAVELQVGRVDLANMPGRLVWGGPASFPSEQELLRQYLNKDHSFRHKLMNVSRRGLIGDYFGVRNGEAFAASGFRSFAPFFSASGIDNLNLIYNDVKGVWIPTLHTNNYLWAYGCGAGSYTTIGGLGNTGQYNDGSAIEMVQNDVHGVFTLLFGSWLGDWDHEDNIMRSVLTTPTSGLTAAWSGRPHWFAHPMGLGETIGYTARLTQNNGSGGLYRNQVNSSAGNIHVALMGDPTLRMHPVAPPGTLDGATNGSSATLIWTPSADSPLGYHVYRATAANGPFTRLNTSLVTSTSFTDSSSPLGAIYMVRAVKLENTPSGTYTNASQGLFWTKGGAPLPLQDLTPPTISLTAPASGATVSGSTVAVSASAADNVGVIGVQFKLDGANLGSEVLAAPFSAIWNTTSAANGSHTLSAVARDLAGNQTSATTLTVNVSNTAASSVVWVEDALPPGAGGAASGGDSWNWVSSNPSPFSGTLAHQSVIAAGYHDHYFNWASTLLTPATGEKLFAYVYLDPANPPNEVMLAWNTSAGDWEHRAYWGANNIPYGTDGTASRRYVGALPAAGQWVRLEVAANAVGLEGVSLQGMSFVLNDGRATWDYAGKSSSSTTNQPPALPTVTVAATDANAAEAGLDPGLFTITRTGDTTSSFTVNYTLGGTATAGSDYNTLATSVTLPVGVASATVVVTPVDDSLVESPETVTLTLASSSAYTLGSPSAATVTLADNDSPPPPLTNAPPLVSHVDYVNLTLPATNSCTLHILSPTTLELRLINAKPTDPARPTLWDFVDANGNFTAPAASQFAVTVNGSPVTVTAVGFKRRPFYAPLVTRDLRLDNCLVLQLASSVPNNATVEVKNPGSALWPASLQFLAANNPLRYSPAIHVNQEGYVPSFPKKAMVGYYLGNLGELGYSASLGFQLVSADTGAVVYQGELAAHLDLGYTYLPAPYQKVCVADFTGFTTPGEYRLVVPTLGASLPFLIDDGIAMAFARTYALGLYHQRCGTNNALPFTRFTHDLCHVAPAEVPSPQSSYPFTWTTVASYANQINADNPPQIAPALTSEAAQLYPFVNKAQRDVHGGHHDAGDYSKYTVNSAGLVHSLMFAVDSFPGAAALDNLGIPESGDGISDLMQEAKWEADYLARIQDADGGFYFLTYPKNREYENNVTPDHGDPQVVWPKTTSSTAAAVAALAQCASSPRFKAQFPTEAAQYLAKARLGWQFLTNAVARYGKDGAYQKITHYGDVFAHNDELAWAACEMFLATGDQTIHQTLKSWFANPNDPATYRWGWWRLWEGYGCAVRSYAFAARSGRLSAGQLDATYLAKCEAEIKSAGNDVMQRAFDSAYGTSFPAQTKAVRGGGWYFSGEQAFDITTAYQLDSRPEYREALLQNMNYEGGCNPVNASYVTGLGWKRQREIVHQYAQNDRRVLPPDGIPQGNVQSYFSYVNQYGTELNAMCYPLSDATTAPYAFYDRWGDVFNVTTEFVALFQARSLASLSFWAAQTLVKTQAWHSATAQIGGLPAQVLPNTPVTATLQVPNLDLSGARIVWEAQGQEPAYGNSFTFTPSGYGEQWIEVEAQWPDGRRVFAATNLFANNALPTVSITSSDAVMTEGGTDTASFTLTRTGGTTSDLVVTLSPGGTATKWNDYRRTSGDMPDSFTIPAGASSATITVYAPDDATLEGTESSTLTIQPGTGYNIGAPNYVTLTIYDAGTTPGDTTAPTVAIAAPANGATVSGSSVTVSASASDNVGVIGVQFKLDGANLGAEDTSAPHSTTLDSTTIANGSHTLTAVARDAAGNQATAAAVTMVVSNAVVLPTVSITSSDMSATEGATDTAWFTLTRSGSTAGDLTVTLAPSGTATKWTDYRRPQGDMPDIWTIPAGSSSVTVTVQAWDDTEVEGTETATLTIQPDAGYNIGSPNYVTLTILDNDSTAGDTTAPAVAITAPANGATVAGSSVTVSANASDNVGVIGVQFKLDGANVGAEDTSAPYSTTFDATTVANGSHTVTAVARDAAGNQTTAAAISIVVSNAVTLPTITATASDANASRVGLDPGVFTLTRTGSTASSLTMNYTLGGTAANGTDYNPLATSVAIPAGAASATLAVTPKPSPTYVAAKTLVLTLAANTAYAVVSPNTATITIAGNGVPCTIGNAPGDNIKITWTSAPGKTYRVAYKDSLLDANWRDLSGNVTATSNKTSWTDTSAGASKQRYYVVYVTK